MNLIEKYKKTLEELKMNKNINSIIIFGSYSKDKQNFNSDLDVALIFKKDINKKKIIEILSNGDNQLDLVNFHEMPLSLQFKIINFGKVYSTNVDLFSIKREVTHEYFDFKPILNRIYESRDMLPIL